jgi:hypothetical protein
MVSSVHANNANDYSMEQQYLIVANLKLFKISQLTIISKILFAQINIRMPLTQRANI